MNLDYCDFLAGCFGGDMLMYINQNRIFFIDLNLRVMFDGQYCFINILQVDSVLWLVIP